MELNKLVAGVCATLLVFLGLNFFAELIYEPHHGGDHALAYALEIEDSGDVEDVVEIDMGALFASADLALGEKVFKKCKGCHKVADGENGSGPHLWNIVNRGIGSVDSFGNYSGNLPADQAWTAANLFAFLENPKGWSNEQTGGKTSMAFKGLKKPEERAALIAYLNEADGSPEPLE